MNDEELQGRINGLSMAVEIALMQAFSLRYGETKKALEAIRSELDGVVATVESDLATSDFRTGTVDSLRLIVTRLDGIYGSRAH